jgi:hypothetical protein
LRGDRGEAGHAGALAEGEAGIGADGVGAAGEVAVVVTGGIWGGVSERGGREGGTRGIDGIWEG